MNPNIYETLRERIIFLDYAPGQILKEQSLATEFGVSRTPLRTVLARLEWEHLVKILPRTGIQVSELELNTITHVFQARLELEGVLGAMAAERFTPKLWDRLHGFTLKCDQLMGQHNPRELAQLDMDTKELFYNACDNPFLIEMSDRLYSLTFRLWYFNMKKMDHPSWDQEVVFLKEDLVALETLLSPGAERDVKALAREVGQTRKDHLLKHLKRIRSTFLGLSGL